jgi:hypothetical protein
MLRKKENNRNLLQESSDIEFIKVSKTDKINKFKVLFEISEQIGNINRKLIFFFKKRKLELK